MEGPGYKSVPLGDDPFSNALRERIKGLPHYRTVLQWKEDIDVPLEKTDYYRWLKDTVESEGSVWGYIKTEEDIIRRCKVFKELYRIAPNWTSESQEPVFKIVLPDGTKVFQGDYPTIIEDDGSLSLLDGWHRMTILIALGLPLYITICGRAPRWQTLIGKLSELDNGILYQPIPHPEFSNWPAHRDGSREEKLRKIITEERYKTVLDLGCCHGFTLYQLSDMAKGEGVENDPVRFEVSKIILSALSIPCHHMDAVAFMAAEGRQYDMILSLAVLHHIAGSHSYDEFYALLNRISKRCKCFIYELPEPWEEGYLLIYPEIRKNIHDFIAETTGFAKRERIPCSGPCGPRRLVVMSN